MPELNVGDDVILECEATIRECLGDGYYEVRALVGGKHQTILCNEADLRTYLGDGGK